MKYTIYDKTGKIAKCTVSKLEYNGEFMGACNITCSVKSPEPVDFVIGDYLDYRGERFYINYDPSVIKKSSKLSIGDAFVYENIVLNSAVDELSRCDFLDYVLSDNLVHFSSLPDFSFFAPSVKDLADRIQANLDRIYKGEQKWLVTVHPDCVGEKNQNVSASRIKVWDALALANSIFKVNFIIRGRHITIGTSGVAANKVFKYGQGNGLKEIERSADDSQAIITRLRVYGSQKNLPHRYYNKIGAKYFVKDTAYRHADVSAEPYYILDAKLGKTFSEDMFNDLHEHITQPTESFTYRCVVTVNGITLPCGIECSPKSDSVGVMFTQSFCSDKALRTKAVQSMLQTTPTEVLFESGVNIDNVPAGNVRNPNYMANNMAVNFLMLPGFPDKTLDPYIDSKNIDSLGIREGSVFFDGSNGNEEICPSIEGMTAEQLKAAGIYVSLDPGDNGKLDEVVTADQATDDGYWDNIPEGKNIPNFTITLKDIGFDLNAHSSTDTMKICMKDGMCGGREFEILGGKNKPVKNGNKWVITCNRVKDESLNLYFPYKDYNIKAGDKFVLTGLEMPDVYIKAASQRLLEAGKKALAKNDYARSIYSPKVDDIELAREHESSHAAQKPSIYDTLKEGDMMLFEDVDLNVNGSIIIDHLSITEEYGSIPHYEITLKEEKSVGTIEKMQQQIDSILGGNSGGGGLNTEQVKSLIKLFGNSNFISKARPDSTEYLLKLLGGAEVGQAIDSFLNGKGTILDKNGRIQTGSIEVRQSLKVMELIINRLQGMENDFVFSPTRKVLRVETIDATTYKLFLDPKMDGDLIPFRDGNIVYSIVNDLLTGGSNYYTSYCRVLTTNQNEYSITISLYPDSEVPGGKNYVPVAGYNISRRGHVNLLTNKEDAQSWYLSSSEGRLLFLQNVVKPVLEDYNYALSIGKIPRIQAVEDINLPQDAVGVMAETIVAQHIYQYDYNGDVVPNIVDRGQWSLSVAQSANRPYRNITATTQRPNGTKYTLLEQHAAWRWGCKWGCLRDKTTEEPKWNAQDWVLLEGDNTYYLDFNSSEGWQFFRGRVNTIITATITHGNEDITDRLITAPGTEVVWLRDSGNVPSDNTWKPTFVNNQPNRLQLTNDDMPSEWGFSIRKVKFVCKVYIPDGAEPIAVNEFGFQI